MELDIQKFWTKWNPTQLKFCSDFEHPEQLLIGGWGSGKTTAGVRKAILLSHFHPGSRGLIARKTYRELFDSTAQTFFEQCPPQLILKYQKRENNLFLKSIDPNLPSVILFRPIDKPEKFQSLELHYIYVDEAGEAFKDEVTYQFLTRRLRQYGMPKHFIFLTSATPSRNSILFKLFVEQKNSNRIIFKVSSYENAENLPDHYIKSLEELPSELKTRFLYGEWGTEVSGQAVFQEFSQRIHVKSLKYDPNYEVIRSWDFGFHRPCCLWAQIDGQYRLKILHEFMGENLYLVDFAKQVIKISNEKFFGATFKDVGDPAGGYTSDKGMSSFDILREEFGIIVYSRKAPVLHRVNLIKKKLTSTIDGEPALQVNKHCEILISALSGGYRYAAPPSGITKNKSYEEPLKDGYYDHIIDCLAYILEVFMPFDKTSVSALTIPRLGILK